MKITVPASYQEAQNAQKMTVNNPRLVVILEMYVVVFFCELTGAYTMDQARAWGALDALNRLVNQLPKCSDCEDELFDALYETSAFKQFQLLSKYKVPELQPAG